MELSRREREKEGRRREILDAARAVFIAKGYEQATLDEVATRAEFAKGTLYTYFGSKAELFEALVDQEFGQVIGEVREATAAAAGVEEVVRAAIRVVLKYVDVHHDFFRIAMAHQNVARREDVERIRDVIFKRVGELAEVAGERLAGAARAGFFKDYDASFLGFLLLGLVHYYSVYRLKYGEGVAAEDAADILCDIFIHGVGRPGPARAEAQ